MRTMTAATVEDVQAIIQGSAPGSTKIQAQGASTKAALTQATDPVTQLDLRGLAGILEYEPGEYTFTALAGTPLHEIAAALAQHHQFMPFDPPLVQAGATLGGTVAAGLSGSGRYRYGGVRDFLIGVRFVDGQGRLVRGGGKVVKNAAGFDLPKLLVGSLGQLGVITEVSFKVFPQPESYATLQILYSDVQAALGGLQRVVDAHFDVYALDLLVDAQADSSAQYQLLIRLGGMPSLAGQRIAQLRQVIGRDIGCDVAVNGTMLTDAADAAVWMTAREFDWVPPHAALVKVAVAVGQITQLEAALAPYAVVRRYAVGGNLLWLAWTTPLSTLDALLRQLGLSGLVLRGAHTTPLIGMARGQFFMQRIKQALDPHQRFPSFE